MHDLHPTNPPRRGTDSRSRGLARRSPATKRPTGGGGRVIPLGATDVASVRRSLLPALGREGRASLFFLHSETGFSEEELLRCALGLEREGLVSVEGRPDGNTSRRMVALTAAGRARRAGGAGGDAKPDTAPDPVRRGRGGEGGSR